MSTPQSSIPALSTPTHISTVPAPTTGETPTTSEPFSVPALGTNATTTSTSTEVDSKAAEEAIKSIDEQLSAQPKEAGVGEKRERDDTEAAATAVPTGLGELKGAEEEAGKEAKKAKVAETGDAGTAPVEAKAGETTEGAHPAKGGAKRGRGGRGGKAVKAAKAAPAQGTRKSARGKGAQAAPQSAVESTKAVGGEANLAEETGLVGVQPQAATEAATTAEGAAQAATEGAPPAQV